MKTICCFGAMMSFGSSLIPLNAQEVAADKVAPVAGQIVAWHQLLATQKSLSLVAVEDGHVEPGFGRDPEFTATIKLFYKGDRFLYDWRYSGPKGLINSAVESFDGEYYENLDRRGRMLSRSSKSFVYDVVMCRSHVLFNPFIFLQSGFSADAYAQLSYKQLTKDDDWKSGLAVLPPAVSVEEVTLEKQQYLKLSNIGKGIDPGSEKPSSFDVYFAKKWNWYPMRWDRRLLNGEMVASYSVEELGFVQLKSGERIPYPKVSVIKNYQDQKLRDTERVEVKEIEFDSVKDSDLWIDPSIATDFVDLV